MDTHTRTYVRMHAHTHLQNRSAVAAGLQEWVQFTLLKLHVSRAVLSLGIGIIFCDADVAWLADARPALSHANRPSKIAPSLLFATDVLWWESPPVRSPNTGVFSAVPDTGAIRVFDRAIERRYARRRGDVCATTTTMLCNVLCNYVCSIGQDSRGGRGQRRGGAIGWGSARQGSALGPEPLVLARYAASRCSRTTHRRRCRSLHAAHHGAAWYATAQQS